MSTNSPSHLVAELTNPSSKSGQVDTLKAIKNDIVGHNQKKENWIAHGLLQPLSQILDSSISTGKQREPETNGNHPPDRPLSQAEQSRLEATLIIDCLARGGPSFLAPIFELSVVPLLIASLVPEKDPPLLTLVILRSLVTIADALALAHPASRLHEKSGFLSLFSPRTARALAYIIEQSYYAPLGQQQIDAASFLVAKTCIDEDQKSVLTNAGVLDALASKLAGFVVSKGYVVPPEHGSSNNEDSSQLPEAAPPSASVVSVLEAITSILKDSKSKFRAHVLLQSPKLAAVLPPDKSFDQSRRGKIKADMLPFLPPDRTSLDRLLPFVPQPQRAPSHHNRLPYAGESGRHQLASRADSRWTVERINPQIGDLDPELGTEDSPLISWLLLMMREEDGLPRVMLAFLLAVLYRLGQISRKREREIAVIVIPPLANIIEGGWEHASGNFGDPRITAASGPKSATALCEERAPMVLAMFVTDAPDLQKAAVEAHAIQSLARGLRSNSVAVSEPDHWRSGRQDVSPASGLGTRLGPIGFSELAVHLQRTREGTLMALAALAPFIDDYRKAIISEGVMPFIVKALKPQEMTFTAPSKVRELDGLDGNPASTLIAACGAVRALSRSVAILRTTFIDFGVALPIFSLLKHENLDVQIAATAVACNLVIEYSPMRTSIQDAGALEVLCQHAHSNHRKLQLNALWALKHLVHKADFKYKLECLKALRPDWIIQLIRGDPLSGTDGSYSGADTQRDTPMSDAISQDRGTNVQPYDLPSGLFDDDREDVLHIADSVGISVLPERNPHFFSVPDSRRYGATTYDGSDLRDREAVQEQGLDFIRNLISEPKDSTDMIDHMFSAFGGRDKMYSLLASIFKPISTTSSIIGQSTSERRPRDEVLHAAIYILVNIAASRPGHRQALVENMELLTLVLGALDHQNPKVRVAVVLMVINLTWVEDESDRSAARGRAMILRSMGFTQKLKRLETDPELDVKERTKTALYQMNSLLSGS